MLGCSNHILLVSTRQPFAWPNPTCPGSAYTKRIWNWNVRASPPSPPLWVGRSACCCCGVPAISNACGVCWSLWLRLKLFFNFLNIFFWFFWNLRLVQTLVQIGCWLKWQSNNVGASPSEPLSRLSFQCKLLVEVVFQSFRSEDVRLLGSMSLTVRCCDCDSFNEFHVAFHNPKCWRFARKSARWWNRPTRPPICHCSSFHCNWTSNNELAKQACKMAGC